MRAHKFGLHHMTRPHHCDAGHGHATAEGAKACSERYWRKLALENPGATKPLRSLPIQSRAKQEKLFPGPGENEELPF